MQINANIGYTISAGGNQDITVSIDDEWDGRDFGALSNTDVESIVDGIYNAAHITVCHHCSGPISDPEIDEIGSVTFTVNDREYSYDRDSVTGVWERR